MSASGAVDLTRWYPVVCRDGRLISLGARQGAFLEGTERIRPLGKRIMLNGNAHDAYQAPGYTVEQIQAIAMSEASLWECDFCAALPASHRIRCGAFRLTHGPNAGGALGGPYRPLMLCSECARYVRADDQRGLLDHAIDAQIERARDLGLMRPDVSRAQARRAIEPLLREVVDGLFTHRQALPEEA